MAGYTIENVTLKKNLYKNNTPRSTKMLNSLYSPILPLVLVCLHFFFSCGLDCMDWFGLQGHFSESGVKSTWKWWAGSSSPVYPPKHTRHTHFAASLRSSSSFSTSQCLVWIVSLIGSSELRKMATNGFYMHLRLYLAMDFAGSRRIISGMT